MNAPDTLLKVLRSGFKPRGEPPTPEPDADLDTRAAAAFAHWLHTHRVSVSGFARVAELSRNTVAALAGRGVAVRWSGVTRSTVERLLGTMRHLEPGLTLDSLRRLLGLPQGEVWEEPVSTAWLLGVPLILEDELRVHLVVDAGDPAPPHVYRADDQTVITQTRLSGLRLGRLMSITPA